MELSVEQKKELEIVERFHIELKKIDHEIRKIIVGQKEVVDQVMMSMLSGGHSIITGVPGLAKTSADCNRRPGAASGFQTHPVHAGPDACGYHRNGNHRRRAKPPESANAFSSRDRSLPTSFSPTKSTELLPRRSRRCWRPCRRDRSRSKAIPTSLEKPFYVLATQNPIELEGTYPLPEAQLDRFMFNIVIDYLSEDDEIKVVNQTTSIRTVEFREDDQRCGDHRIPALVRKMPVAESVMRYAVQLARTSRPSGANPPDFVKQYVNYGASLRASQFLILGAKARALMNGRYNVAVEDIQTLAYPVFRHRILTNFHAESEGITSENIIKRLLETVPVPKSGVKD